MTCHENLSNIARDLKQGEAVNAVPVRELLAWFGATRRGITVVANIQDALAHHGLRTRPDFERAYIDSHVTFERVSGETAPDATPTPWHPGIAYCVSRLRQASMPVACANPHTSLLDALTRMRLDDFSQLPVTDANGRPHGMVSWRSIGRSLRRCGVPATVGEAMEPCSTISPQDYIFQAIRQVSRDEAVVVLDTEGCVQGIITSHDLNEQFEAWTEPFLLLSEIETALRRLIDARIPATTMQAANGVPADTQTAAELIFGQYVSLFRDTAAWAATGIPLEQQLFCDRLDQIRKIRNAVMHFDPDGLVPEDLEMLRKFSVVVKGLV